MRANILSFDDGGNSSFSAKIELMSTNPLVLGVVCEGYGERVFLG